VRTDWIVSGAPSLLSNNHKMPIDLYYFLASPPCRSVMLVAKALKIELNLKVTELSKGDNKTPEYLKVEYEILVLHVLPGNSCKLLFFYVPQDLNKSVTTVCIAL